MEQQQAAQAAPVQDDTAAVSLVGYIRTTAPSVAKGILDAIREGVELEATDDDSLLAVLESAAMEAHGDALRYVRK